MNHIKEMLEAKLGSQGRLISGSKGQYSWDNPDNFVVFNANIFNSDGQKMWYGDIDLSTQDFEILKESALEAGTFLFILNEMDGRFENENSPLLQNAVAVFSPSGRCQINPELEDYIVFKDRPFVKKTKLKDIAIQYPNMDVSEYTKIDIKNVLNAKFSQTNSPLDELISMIVNVLGKDVAENTSISDIYWSQDTNKKFESILETYCKRVLKIDGYELQKTMIHATLDLPSVISNGDELVVYVKTKK